MGFYVVGCFLNVIIKKETINQKGGKVMIGSNQNELERDEKIDVLHSIPFFIVHAIGIVGPFFTGISKVAVVVALSLYFIRMFFVTGIGHRYFSHKSYRVMVCPKVTQGLMAFLFTTCVQKGAVWWASHHRHHHKHSDKPEDVHSRKLRGLYWSHIGWILCPKYHSTNEKLVGDLKKYPELMFFERFHLLGPVVLAVLCAILGLWLGPQWGTSWIQMLVVGFFTSTVLLWHGTFAINSFAHMIGSQRFNTGDESRNSFFLAILTLGEGWHNNHHHAQNREAQALMWWEYPFDVTHCIIRIAELAGFVQIKKR